MLSQFTNTCKNEIERKKVQLLYRGSRDGFKADDFHRHCDDKANTITIIKSADGNIFGGYTQAKWSSNTMWCNDSNAYLFSLVNPMNQPFVSKIRNPSNAIYCSPSFGPVFGAGHDIHIADSANVSISSFESELNSYECPFDLEKYDYLFNDSEKFLVKEIEVFQIKI